MNKYTVILLLIFMTPACEGGSTDQVDTEKLTAKKFQQQSNYLLQALKDTPYSALVKITSVKTIDLPDDDPEDDYAEQKLVYNADVIETYRGALSSKLSFNMYVEKGDSIGFDDEPFIITLCKSKDGFYWPGTGASFSADAKLLTLAKEQVSKLDKSQTTFNSCDD